VATRDPLTCCPWKDAGPLCCGEEEEEGGEEVRQGSCWQVLALFLIFIFLLYRSPRGDIRTVAKFEYSSNGGFLERVTVPCPRLLSP